MSFRLDFAENALPTIVTDQAAAAEVVKNLLSNAFKFTESGGVVLRVGQAEGRQFAGDVLATRGPGDRLLGRRHGRRHPADKLRLIFEAFQQADGTTSRRYGRHRPRPLDQPRDRVAAGRRDPRRVGPGEGSTFTLYLPETYADIAEPKAPADSSTRSQPGSRPRRPRATAATSRSPLMLLITSEVDDDRESIEEGDRVVLIVEDDADRPHRARDRARAGFKGSSPCAATPASLSRAEFRPDAIVLDMTLPVLDGWTVLDRLKRHPRRATSPSTSSRAWRSCSRR